MPFTVGVAGAGPAGLYAALLLKKAKPGANVRVVERNPAGATYGFGVVLSDRTLTAFREADQLTFDAITAHQLTWDAIEVIWRGVPVRCEGHSYLGIARKRLLDILQRRCEELGVNVQYDTELRGLAPFDDCDLIIGADGVNSRVRSLHARAFRPRLSPGQSKYVWLGVRWAPTAFTFAFAETEHGLFQAHMYPYDRGAATCVLMCRDETWRRAGLDRMSETESLAFCQRLLAPYTGGARVLSNRSLWTTFQTVRCAKWSHGNVVLLGDAAHTAHWSIGSGTKLAMEDAIALVRALSAAGDLPRALARYEAERRPVVERLQAAGRVSERYCEGVGSSRGLDPVAFAFQLMTRSGRVDYDALAQRDSSFIDAVNGRFGGVEPVRAPLRLRDVVLPGRLVGEGVVFASGLDEAGAVRARGARAALRVSNLAHVRAAAEAGFDLLELAAARLFPAARAVWPQGRPLAVALGDGGDLAAAVALARSLAAQGCDLVTFDSDSPALGEAVKAEAGGAVMLRAGSRAAANTLVAGARADLVQIDGIRAEGPCR
jgi:anthraniloyl-CoA monooxygenase